MFCRKIAQGCFAGGIRMQEFLKGLARRALRTGRDANLGVGERLAGRIDDHASTGMARSKRSLGDGPRSATFNATMSSIISGVI